ncbi:restriction endonuclease subunit S, partial [Planctomycetota bacterium]
KVSAATIDRLLTSIRDSSRIGKLCDITHFYNGKARPDNVDDGLIPIYGGNGILGFTNQYNSEDVTIIIGRVGAYCGSLYIEHKPIWLSDNALCAKSHNKNYMSYLYYLLKSLHLNGKAEGSSQPLLTQTLLNSIEINIPPENLITLFVSLADGWLKKNELNTRQIKILSKLRDTLLPRLMKGKIRIKRVGKL